MEINYQTFNQFLNNIENYREFDVVFIPRGSLTLDSICLVHDPNDVEDESLDEPKPARNRNLIYGLDMLDLKSIKANLLQQGLIKMDNSTFLKAIVFYLENDAFIPIEQL